MRPVYLDNNATTRTDPAVVAAMLPFFSEQFANASSAHDFGRSVATSVREARRSLQELIGAESEFEIVFTSGGTEADNTAILSALATQQGRDEIITSAVEHPAILALLDHLEHSGRVRVHRIGVDGDGGIDLNAFDRALGPRTALVSVMWANNETGALFPVQDLARRSRKAGALFHTDAVQVVGKIAIDLKSTDIDLLSLSGHKFHGPKGIGALYARKGTPFAPLVHGGPQERRRRAGTENVPAIVGLGVAARLAAAAFDGMSVEVRALRDRLERSILRSVGHCTILGDTERRIPNTTTISFAHLDGEAILHHLAKAGIAVSLGSACSSGSMRPSHVLRAMKVPSSLLRGAIRFSLSRETTADDVARVVSEIPPIIARIRAASPSWHCAAPDQTSAELEPLT